MTGRVGMVERISRWLPCLSLTVIVAPTAIIMAARQVRKRADFL
jgi:hypothetical protein